MDYITEMILKVLVKNNIIAIEDYEMYSFGMNQLIFTSVNIITTIFIGLYFSMVWEIIIFMTAYIVIRVYAGGYHAKTQCRCYFISIILLLVALWGVKYLDWNNPTYILITTISAVIIFFLAPVDSIDKRLDQLEMEIYSKKAKVILGVIYCSFLMLKLMGKVKIASCIAMSMIILSGVLLLGKAINFGSNINETG